MVLSCGLASGEIIAEANKADREVAELARRHELRLNDYLNTLSKDKRYYRRNRAVRMHDAALARARKKNAVPSWLSKEDLALILALFEFAIARETATGIPHSVDHIVPIKGICRKTWRAHGQRVHTVCGLHVPGNLRVIPHAINRDLKSDWFDSDWHMPMEVEPLEEFESPHGDDDIPF